MTAGDIQEQINALWAKHINKKAKLMALVRAKEDAAQRFFRKIEHAIDIDNKVTNKKIDELIKKLK